MSTETTSLDISPICLHGQALAVREKIPTSRLLKTGIVEQHQEVAGLLPRVLVDALVAPLQALV